MDNLNLDVSKLDEYVPQDDGLELNLDASQPVATDAVEAPECEQQSEEINDTEESLEDIDTTMLDVLSEELNEVDMQTAIDTFVASGDMEGLKAYMNISQEAEKNAEGIAAVKAQEKMRKNKKYEAAKLFDKPTATNPYVVNIDKVNACGVNGYIIIPDLHAWYKNIGSTRAYVSSIIKFLDFLMDTILSDPTIQNVIFAGDIFERGFDSVDSAKLFNNYFSKLKMILNKRGGQLYSVIGNHEYTYLKDSLFWFMQDSVIKTPNLIIDNDVKIVLDHYASPKSNRERYIEIEADVCITHNEVLPTSLREEMRRETGMRLFTTTNCEALSRFNVKDLLVGHLHTAVGRYVVLLDESDTRGRGEDNNNHMRVQWMGSIGRTNVEEYNDELLLRELAVVRIKADSTYKMDYVQYTLEARGTSIIQEKVIANLAMAERRKEVKAMKSDTVSQDPIGEIKDLFENHPFIVELLDNAKNNTRPETYNALIATYDRAISIYSC